MVRPDYFNNYENLPEYYDTMYLDGFEPWQIWAASMKKQKRLYKEAQEA